MSDLTNLTEAIKAGELAVVARKLVSLQSEITNALSKINSLTTEVQGGSNVTGVIHSPARTDNTSASIEIFEGDYFVGDTLGSRKATFTFGIGSECFFNFTPSKPTHGVNKKYVDQIISPLTSQIANMISRNGDHVPYPQTIDPCTYIFTNDTSPTPNKTRWLINGRGDLTSNETAFNTMSKDLSLFWLQVDDARYYGNTLNDPHNLMTLGSCDARYVRIGNGNNVGTVVDFDSTSMLTWKDDRDISVKSLAAHKYELANMKNLTDFFAGVAKFSQYGIQQYIVILVLNDVPHGTSVVLADHVQWKYADGLIPTMGNSQILFFGAAGFCTYGTGSEATSRQESFNINSSGLVHAENLITGGGGGANHSSADGKANVIVIALRNANA